MFPLSRLYPPLERGSKFRGHRLEATSESGIKGETVTKHRNSRGDWMNSLLILKQPGKDEKEFRSFYTWIEKWGFGDADKSVVIRSRNAHGPSRIEKYDIASGKLLAECSGSDLLKDTPEWARPFCDLTDSGTKE